MRNCGTRTVKCGIENAEWRGLVKPSNHVTAVIPHITAATEMTSQNRHSIPHFAISHFINDPEVTINGNETNFIIKMIDKS